LALLVFFGAGSRESKHARKAIKTPRKLTSGVIASSACTCVFNLIGAELALLVFLRNVRLGPAGGPVGSMKIGFAFFIRQEAKSDFLALFRSGRNIEPEKLKRGPE
jgi:hypothetical protein